MSKSFGQHARRHHINNTMPHASAFHAVETYQCNFQLNIALVS